MAIKKCSIPDCGRKHYSRTWCQRHYLKWRRFGDPLAGREYQDTPEEAFLVYTEPLLWSGCLVWTASRDPTRYGSIWVDGRYVGAHRYAWEREHGPIPEGAFVDHRYHCDPTCCETSHLRLATRAQNGANRAGANRNNTLGVRGVYRMAGGRYAAQVRKDGVRHHASFETLEEAAEHAARLREYLFGAYRGDG